MAERRMFAKSIVDSDMFLDMPVSARLLYYDLGMRADDDGFINSPKRTMKLTGASDDDMKLLIAKQFVIPFDSGVVVIKHWKIHNYIQKDRYKETIQLQEKSQLLTCENKEYELTDTKCIHDGNNLYAQYRLGKDSIGKDRLGEDSIEKKKPVRHKYGEYNNVLLSDEDYEKLVNEFPIDYQERIERLSEYMASTGKSYKNHLATIRNWARKEKPVQKDNNGFSFKDLKFDEEGNLI